MHHKNLSLPAENQGGRIRAVSNEELDALRLTRAANDCFESFYHNAKADRKGHEDLFADHIQAIGRDRGGWIVYTIITIAFRGDQDLKNTLTYAVTPGAQREFKRYVARKLTEHYEALKLAWLSPELLWFRKPVDHRIPREEVETTLTTYLVEKLRPEWDSKTTYRTNWHLRREEGLWAWARHEAQEQIKIISRASFDLEEFQQTRRAKFSKGLRQFADWLQSHPDNFTKLENYLHTASTRINPLLKILCVEYDRHETPFEYWSSRAITQFLSILAPHFRQSAPNETLVRQWLSRLRLTRANPIAVLRYIPAQGKEPEKLRINRASPWAAMALRMRLSGRYYGNSNLVTEKSSTSLDRPMSNILNSRCLCEYQLADYPTKTPLFQSPKLRPAGESGNGTPGGN